MKGNADRVFEQLLVLQAQAGKADAIRLLVKRWHPRLVRHAMQYTGELQAAQDAAQESWIAILRNIRSVSDPVAFGAWALRITGRKAIDWERKARRMRRNAEHHANTLYQPEEEHEEANAQIANLRKELRNLPEQQRYTLTLFYLEGFTIREIADILDQPVGTIKARLFHAREQLKKKFKHQRHETSI
ncbi:MAG: RNA polymerase sigma factor [Saprospiraceae bacterium]|nr:RNA polymerase sigma factor [Saprospiraceae bacterium]